VVGQLGKRLGGSHSNADWQADMALDGFSKSLAVGSEPQMLKPREIQEAFVNRIHLLAGEKAESRLITRLLMSAYRA
jgi:hypothetical protein